jgi:nucleoid-associated protein YgaU
MLSVAGAAVVAMVMALPAAPAMAQPVGTHAGEPAMSHSAERVGAQPGEPAMTDLAMPAIPDPVVDQQPIQPFDQQAIQPLDQQPIFNNADMTGFTGFNHVVQPEDTLSGIAENLGTTHDVLASENGLSNPDLIFPGQVIGHSSS